MFVSFNVKILIYLLLKFYKQGEDINLQLNTEDDKHGFISFKSNCNKDEVHYFLINKKDTNDAYFYLTVRKKNDYCVDFSPIKIITF